MLSHFGAAALWGIVGRRGGPIDVSVPSRGRRGIPGVRLHRPSRIEALDCDRRDRIPVTTPSRTLLDLAAVMSRSRLSRAVEESDRLGLLELRAAQEDCERHRHRAGAGKLRKALEELAPVSTTRSELERSFLEFVRESGFPNPSTNVTVNGFEVDAFWPAYRLIVELDGHEFHRSRAAFERDRARDGVLQGVGYRVIRLTYRRLRDDRQGVVELLRRLLALCSGWDYG